MSDRDGARAARPSRVVVAALALVVAVAGATWAADLVPRSARSAVARAAPGRYTFPPLVASPPQECAAAVASRWGVLAVGDSILAAGARDLAARLAREHRPVCYDARPLRTTEAGIEVLAAQPRLPATILVELGSNDADRAERFGGYIDAVLGLAGQQRTVIWVNVHLQRADRLAADTAATREIDRELASAARRHRNLRVVDWDRYVSSRPRLLQPDGIHPTYAGNRARNALVARLLGPGAPSR